MHRYVMRVQRSIGTQKQIQDTECNATTCTYTIYAYFCRLFTHSLQFREVDVLWRIFDKRVHAHLNGD